MSHVCLNPCYSIALTLFFIKYVRHYVKDKYFLCHKNGFGHRTGIHVLTYLSQCNPIANRTLILDYVQ